MGPLFQTMSDIQCRISDQYEADVLSNEFLLFRYFQCKPLSWYKWKDWFGQNIVMKNNTLEISGVEILRMISDAGLLEEEEPQFYLSLCYILVHRTGRLLDMIKLEIERQLKKNLPKQGETLLMRYFNSAYFTVLNLDEIFKEKDDKNLPPEIFKCCNVKILSLKSNYLTDLPCDIGQMASLEQLVLTDNTLTVHSLPYSLTFLQQLKIIMLDHNLLQAFPGFLLHLHSLECLRRRGNHYQWKTFFIAHHKTEARIQPAVCNEKICFGKYESLQFWCAKNIIASKQNFYQDPDIATELKDYISSVYHLFNICHNCNKACFRHKEGFDLITLKHLYLGNSCVPFQHWTCSVECAREIENEHNEERHYENSKKIDLVFRNFDQFNVTLRRRRHRRTNRFVDWTRNKCVIS